MTIPIIEDSKLSVSPRLWAEHHVDDFKQPADGLSPATAAFRKQLQADMVAAREKRLQEA